MAEEAKKKKDRGLWFREMKSELKKVVWPSKKQVINNTLIVIACCIAVGIFFGNKFLIGLYNNDPAIIAVGSGLLSMVALIQPFQCSQFVLAGALRGAGDTKYTAMVVMLTAMLLRPGLAILFINRFGLGLNGAWYALVVDQVVRTALVFYRYHSAKWLTSFKPAASKAEAK